MFRHNRIYIGILLFALPVSASTLPEKFTLGRCVPNDCWLYVHSIDTPENDYFNECWGRVFTALANSGISDDLKNLILSDIRQQKDRQEFQNFWNTSASLLSGVNWGDLVGTEFVFAERFAKGVPMPEFLLLSRMPDKEARTHNLAGLKAILASFAELGDDVTFSEEKSDCGSEVASVYIVNSPITFHVFSKGDIVGIAMGCGILRDSLALVRHEPRKSILDEPRFQKALKEITPPEIQVSWIDISMMMESICSLPNLIAPPSGSTGPACPSKPQPTATIGSTVGSKASLAMCNQQVVLANDVQAREEVACVQGLIANILKETDIIDYVITTSRIEGMQQKCSTVCRMKSDAKDKLFGKIISNTRTLDRFDRFIPQEATGFSVSASLDPSGIYTGMMDFLKEGGELTKGVLGWWETTCTSIGLNPEEDIFSWISGETISVTMKPVVPSPFGGDDSVLMIKIKDSAKAVEKCKALFAWINTFLAEAEQDPIVLAPVEIAGSNQFFVLRHTHPMAMFITIHWGVYEDWLVVGTSAPAIEKCIAAGKPGAKTIMDNPRFQKEGFVTKGPVAAASFTDLQLWAQQVAGALTMLNFSAQMFPGNSPEERKAKSLLLLASRLGPVIAQVNFLSSSATVTTVKGDLWMTENVMTYIKLEPPTTAPAQSSDPAPPTTEPLQN